MTTFVYGTLMFPEVLKALIHREPPSQPASIPGYQRWRIRGQVFPGIVPPLDLPSGQPAPRVQGLLLSDLTEQELYVFDAFEGSEYEKRSVAAQPEAGGAEVPATVYVWKEALRPLLLPDSGDWDPQEFRERHLAEYALMCARFSRELAAERPWDWKNVEGS